MKKLSIIIALLLSVSCSMNDFEKVKDDFDDFDEDVDEAGRSISSKASDGFEEAGSFLKDDEEADSFLKDDEEVELFEDDKGDGVFVYGNENIKEARDKMPSTHVPTKQYSGKYMEHTVKKGETLMWISFQIYGDYSRWREIRRLNSAKIMDYTHLKEGTVLSYRPAKNPYVRPTGDPYLVKWGDTLSKVSRKVYGTSGKWKNIWKNNPRQIKNPNLIFAGFTLFYPDQTGKKMVYSAL